ncbi:MAG: serine--tRNA ligase [Chloroflexi bacterium]|nr:serine--tRNA ligase [Chloroflexota bacterium]
MLSLDLIRKSPEVVRRSLERRGDAASLALLARIGELDGRRRTSRQGAEALRARQNRLTRLLGPLRGAKGGAQLKGFIEKTQATMADDDLRAALLRFYAMSNWDKLDGWKSVQAHAISELMKLNAELATQLQALEKQDEGAPELEQELNDLLLSLPNIVDEAVPDGAGPADNQVVATSGEPPAFPFTPKPHWELGESLGIIDFARGVKLSGTRFYVLMGLGARLQRALIAFMLDVHTTEHGYTEVYPPFMVKREALVGSGNLPKFGDNLYHDAEDDLWLIPTAEVPITNLHRDEILEALPLYYVAYTACFRREKMSAGRDTRGIKRGHQFDKVEMYKFVAPESSGQELDRMVADATDLCRRLGLPHRVVQLCAGDLGFASAKSYDIEVWAPGCGEWLEVSSCSNCADFQARRANIRYRPQAGGRPQFVHTLNGSGLALPRILIAVLENFQQADGSVIIPGVLRPYLGGAERITSAK